jgi:hypothetical protein
MGVIRGSNVRFGIIIGSFYMLLIDIQLIILREYVVFGNSVFRVPTLRKHSTFILLHNIAIKYIRQGPQTLLCKGMLQL